MKNELILEIGTEEIPALFLEESTSNLNQKIKQEFEKNSLSFEDVQIFYTPRRIVVKVSGLLPKQKDQVIENFGPPKKIAFDENGKPTKAAIGFAKSQGVDVNKLDIAKRDNGEFLAFKKKVKGRKTDKVLIELFPEIIHSIPFRKSMRWGYGKKTFARPIRWLMCLYERKKLSFEFENIKSGNKSYGHRFSSTKPFSPKNWTDYLNELKKNDVLLDQTERKEFIDEEINKLASKLGGFVKRDEELLETVTNLVEYPVVLNGTFEKRFLKLPEEVLISVMKNHQKYFPVFSKSKKLLPYFIFVSGTQVKDNNIVIKGNERVIRARFTDAEFFWNEDIKKPLDNNISELKSMVFLSKIGNYFEKTRRLENLSNDLALLCKKQKIKDDLKRSATLSKADLVSQMVFEFPELQGTMGKYYANESREKTGIARAIKEHYMPVSRDGDLPVTEIGALLSITDKIDNIASCFSAGLKPTGSADPYALRRQAIGVIQIVLDRQFIFNLETIFENALKKINKATDNSKTLSEIINFISERFKNLMLNEGYSNSVIDSVLSTGFDNIVDSYNRIKAVEKFNKQKGFEELSVAFKRVVNIAKEKPKAKLNTKLFKDKSESNLYKSFSNTQKKTDKYLNNKSSTSEADYIKALNLIKTLKEPIDFFFDSVMVMDKDRKLKNNRLALLNEIKTLFFKISDFSKI